MDDAGAAAIDRQLGGLLARLHAVHPGPVGLLGPDLRVATPLSDADADADAGLAGFVDRCITRGRGAAGLGPALTTLTSGLRAMIATEARLVDLTAWAEFLDRPSISDGLLHTTRRHIGRTITIITGTSP